METELADEIHNTALVDFTVLINVKAYYSQLIILAQ